MAAKKVLVNFIQDRSGSMQDVWAETLSGFKHFVKDLRDNAAKDGVEYVFSLTTFDTQVETPIVGLPIADVDVDALEKHGPRGSTALYDAVGATIKNIEDNRYGAEKIIVVIVTDGHENSSRDWTKTKLQTAIEAKLNAGDWTFTYLGTQPETWDDAGAIGISMGATSSYTGNMASAAYAVTSDAVRTFSRSASMGTRSLMADHVSPRAAARAGMKVKPVPKKAPALPELSAKAPARWR